MKLAELLIVIAVQLPFAILGFPPTKTFDMLSSSKSLILAGVLWSCLAVFSARAQQDHQKPRNVLVLYSDDQSYNTIR
jgi:hypothetical protein